MEILGTYIRKLRMVQGYSARQLGRLIDVPEDCIWKVERGDLLLSRWQLLQLAARLKINETKLLMTLQKQLLTKADKESVRESVRSTLLKNEWNQWEKIPPSIHVIFQSKEMDSFLESIVYYLSNHQSHTRERVMPEGRARLIIDLSKRSTILIGPSSTPQDILYSENSRRIIIRFQAYGLYMLTGIPQHQLLNRMLDAEYIFGNAIRQLQTELQTDQNLDAISTRLHRFFQARITRSNARVIQEQVVRYVVYHMDKPIAQLVEKSGYSAKHLINLVRDYTGLTPKVLQQVMHFSNTLQQVSLLPTHHISDIPWGEIYFDQSHIIKQFKRFSGLTPSAYLQTGNVCSRMVLL